MVHLDFGPSTKLDPDTFKVPVEYQETLSFYLACLLLFCVTNATLDIAWIRHRWRYAVLASKFLGMISIIWCLMWPHPIVVFCLSISFANGFSDPRLHVSSIGRNKANVLLKWWFALTLTLHHVGGAFLTNEVVQRLIAQGQQRAPGDAKGDLPMPMLNIPLTILISCLCELFAWFTDLKVLMRTAPKWFTQAHQVAVVIQISCFVITFFYLPPGLLNTHCLFGTVIGSASWLVAGWIGFKNSTHEVMEDVDLKASVARVYHKNAPITKDDSIMPFCKKDALKIADQA